jgi:hypothetical protein
MIAVAGGLWIAFDTTRRRLHSRKGRVA